MTAKSKHREHIVTLVASLPDGTHIIEHPGGKLERRKSETDWAAFDALTDEQIEASIKNDPDWSDDWNWGDAVLVIPPKKKAISIRVDEDVLDYFRHEGAGYQRRINAVLRSYMQQKKNKKRKRA
ncbi:MAG: BrnA antitoxin family protein [Rhizobiales bacterium]|nr:BrnA antitoxin family protein [Hyphomicrobiales bacterium]